MTSVPKEDANASQSPEGEHGVTLQDRIQIVHAVVQKIADTAGIDVLHIKGPIIAAQFPRPDRTATDVDILVRPQQARRLVEALTRHGWQLRHRGGGQSGLSTHASCLEHSYWKLWIDLHHEFPGFEAPSYQVFDLLWSRRTSAVVAGVSCVVPSTEDHGVLIALHYVRTGWSRKSARDFAAVRNSVGERQLWCRGKELHAQEALLVVLPTAAGERTRVTHYWQLRHAGAPRVAVWVARIQMEAGVARKVRVLRRAVAPPLPMGLLEWQGTSQHSAAALRHWSRGVHELLGMVTRRNRSR